MQSLEAAAPPARRRTSAHNRLLDAVDDDADYGAPSSRHSPEEYAGARMAFISRMSNTSSKWVAAMDSRRLHGEDAKGGEVYPQYPDWPVTQAMHIALQDYASDLYVVSTVKNRHEFLSMFWSSYEQVMLKSMGLSSKKDAQTAGDLPPALLSEMQDMAAEMQLEYDKYSICQMEGVHTRQKVHHHATAARAAAGGRRVVG